MPTSQLQCNYVYMHNCGMPPTQPLKAEAQSITHRAKALGLNQVSIATAIGRSQSQVSRALSGQSKLRSRVFDQICKYVSQVEASRTLGQEIPGDLSAAVASVWDGTPRHAEALALVIRSLGALTPPSATPPGRPRSTQRPR